MPGPQPAYLGYSFGQFALPVRGGPAQPFDWNPAANVHSPPVVIPLVARAADGTVALLAPIDAWHDQIIAVDAGFAVAATREKAVHIFTKDEGGRAQHVVADVPGAPDNVTFAGDGDVIAALHPNLIRLALNRKLGLGKAGSRIVRINAQSHDADLLFDDPSGAVFSAATVGVETDLGLVAGSVTDAGVLVCEKAS